MTRINVYETDEATGERTLAGWFDATTAEAFAEDTRWDGSNHISIPTGNQWNHEMLYRTAGGRWVLHWWSQWQGTEPTYRFIPDGAAREWLIANGTDEDAVTRLFGPTEPERGPGRPEVGRPVNIRLGDDLLSEVDSYAEAEGIGRAEVIRRLVRNGLRATDR